LALKPNNAISVDPSNFGVTTDPHSFRNFLGREQIVQIFNFNTSMPAETILYSTYLSPDSLTQSLFYSIVDWYYFYASSLIFRLSFVKNAFYSGRISVEFLTNGLGSSALWDPGNPSIVFDLKDNKELVFRLPFVSPHRILPYYDFFGRLIIRVINPLKVNDTYPQTIQANLSVIVDEDMTFCAPINSTLTYAQGLALDEPHIEATSDSIVSRAVDLLPLPPLSPNNLVTVGGEFTTGISDMIKRSVYDLTLTSFFCSYDPYDFSRVYTSYHPMQRLSAFFRFCRGSTRIKFMLVKPPSTISGVVDTHCTLNCTFSFTDIHFPPSAVPIVAPVRSYAPESRVSAHLNNVLEVSLPYYSKSDRLIIGKVSDVDMPFYNFWIEASNSIFTEPPVFDIYFSAGEDFSFGFPCGMPKLS